MPYVPYLLNLIYLLLILVSLPWLVWQAISKGKYREGFGAKLLGLVPPRRSARPCIWLHAVSVGEVNLLATLIGEIGQRQPEWECVISTTTMTTAPTPISTSTSTSNLTHQFLESLYS